MEKFAEKIAWFCTHNGLKTIVQAHYACNGEIKLFPASVLHFPKMNWLPQWRYRKTAKHKIKKISVDLLFRARPLSHSFKEFYEAAFDAHKCCRKQDLHLYSYNEIYERRRLRNKHVCGWKIPKGIAARKQLNYYADNIKRIVKQGSSSYQVEMVLLGEEGRIRKQEEKRLKEHLELQKQLKERRDYYANPRSIFN